MHAEPEKYETHSSRHCSRGSEDLRPIRGRKCTADSTGVVVVVLVAVAVAAVVVGGAATSKMERSSDDPADETGLDIEEVLLRACWGCCDFFRRNCDASTNRDIDTDAHFQTLAVDFVVVAADSSWRLVADGYRTSAKSTAGHER